jgi:hypothetical protein
MLPEIIATEELWIIDILACPQPMANIGYGSYRNGALSLQVPFKLMQAARAKAMERHREVFLLPSLLHLYHIEHEQSHGRNSDRQPG